MELFLVVLGPTRPTGNKRDVVIYHVKHKVRIININTRCAQLFLILFVYSGGWASLYLYQECLLSLSSDLIDILRTPINTVPEVRIHTVHQIQLPYEEASKCFNHNVQILCSYGQIQCGELPFVNRSLNNKLVQNYMETKHPNENNQAEYISTIHMHEDITLLCMCSW